MIDSSGSENRTPLGSRCHETEQPIQTQLDATISYVAISLNISFSIAAYLGNLLILFALRKDCSLHPPSKLLFRCLASTDLCVGLFSQPLFVMHMISVVDKNWTLCLFSERSAYVVSAALSGVSILTLSAISTDRLLALRLKMRYRECVNIERVRVVIFFIWITSSGNALLYLVDGRVYFAGSCTLIFLAIGVASICYTRIFLTLRLQSSRVVDILRDGQSNGESINIARYKNTVYTVLFVHSVVVLCYVPYAVVSTIKVINGETPVSFLIEAFAATLVYFNSSLNPVLYCWKIKEVREAVKQIIMSLL